MNRSFILSLIFFAEYIVISLTGVCLIYFGIVDFGYKIYVLGATLGVAVIPVSTRIIIHQWSFEDLGFQFKDFMKALPWYALSIPIGIFGLFLYTQFFPEEIYKGTTDTNTYFVYSVWGVIAQEILYRGYLMRLGQQVFGDGWFNICINVIVFVGMHIFYPGFVQKLWILIPAGILFTLLYQRYPNIILIIITHSILNGVSVALGIFN